MKFNDIEIFRKSNGESVSYEDLLRDIYDNNEETKQQILDSLSTLVTFMKSADEAVLLMSHLTALMDSKIKNDDILIKMAAIIARQHSKSKDKNPVEIDGFISESEKIALLEEASKLVDESQKRVRNK